MMGRLPRCRSFWITEALTCQTCLLFTVLVCECLLLPPSAAGVCGAVSKFGTSCCQAGTEAGRSTYEAALHNPSKSPKKAFGVPAMPVAQPGHCALIWRGPLGRRMAQSCLRIVLLFLCPRYTPVRFHVAFCRALGGSWKMIAASWQPNTFLSWSTPDELEQPRNCLASRVSMRYRSGRGVGGGGGGSLAQLRRVEPVSHARCWAQ